MAAYVIADIEVLDSLAYEEYRQKVPATIAAYGGRYLARNDRSMRPLARLLSAEGCRTRNLDYPSRSVGLDQLFTLLDREVQACQAEKPLRIHFVTCSRDRRRQRLRAERQARGHGGLPRIPRRAFLHRGGRGVAQQVVHFLRFGRFRR